MNRCNMWAVPKKELCNLSESTVKPLSKSTNREKNGIRRWTNLVEQSRRRRLKLGLLRQFMKIINSKNRISQIKLMSRSRVLEAGIITNLCTLLRLTNKCSKNKGPRKSRLPSNLMGLKDGTESNENSILRKV